MERCKICELQLKTDTVVITSLDIISNPTFHIMISINVLCIIMS